MIFAVEEPAFFVGAKPNSRAAAAHAVTLTGQASRSIRIVSSCVPNNLTAAAFAAAAGN
jgi:hypothetical protein